MNLKLFFNEFSLDNSEIFYIAHKTIPQGVTMQTARIKKVHKQTFKEWLAEEVMAGRIIPPRGTGETPPLPNLSDMPKNFDFQAFYEDCRGEKFQLCSFDNNMLKIAKEFGFETTSITFSTLPQIF